MTRPANKADKRVAELVALYRAQGLEAAKKRFAEIEVLDELKLFESVVIAGRFRREAGL